jgi:hypothetical protein
MGVPHGNDVHSVPAWRPHQNHHAPPQHTGGDETNFAVIKPVISTGQHIPIEDLARLSEIKPSVSESSVTLQRVEGDDHRLCIYGNQAMVNFHHTETTP